MQGPARTGVSGGHSSGPHPSSTGTYCMTSSMSGWSGEVRGGSKPHQRYERSGGLNHLTSDMLGEERLPWGGEVLVFPVLPVAKEPVLPGLVTFYTWTIPGSALSV